MEEKYVEFLCSDAMIVTYEIIVLIVVLFICIRIFLKQREQKKRDSELKEKTEWNQLQDSLKNDRRR